MSCSKYVQIKCSGRRTVDIETKKNCKKYFFKSISRTNELSDRFVSIAY